MPAKYRYQEIYEQLKARIEHGTYDEANRLPGARSLAVEFETTAVTVGKSLALLESEGYLVRKAKRGAFINPSSLRHGGAGSRQKTGLIGAIVFDSSVSVYWSRVLTGMEDAVSENGRHLVVGHSDHRIDKAIRYVNELAEKGIDGFIFVPIDMPDEATYERENLRVIEALDSTGRPYVLFDRHLNSVKRPYVGPDSYEPATALTESLFEKGVTNPLCVSLYYGSVIGDRQAAFCDVLGRHGISNPEKRIIRLNTYRLTDRLIDHVVHALEQHKDADGIFCVNSNTLNGVAQVVSALGMPANPVIVGFEELEIVHREMVSALAVQPISELGRTAGNLVLRMVDDPDGTADSVTQIYLPCKLVYM